MVDIVKRYRQQVKLRHLHLFRYEDVIYEKKKWVRDICSYFGWDVTLQVQDAIAKEFDIVPERERADQHIRQVHPGNYRSKLKLSSIRKIEDVFGEEMAFFGYERYSPAL